MPEKKPTLVVTSINPPNSAIRELAAGCLENGWGFVLAGDRKTPNSFELPGCEFISISDQKKSGFRLAEILPENTYARKNLGYLIALSNGAETIVETDDDNHPLEAFWNDRSPESRALTIQKDGWINAYAHFSDTFIYPRGLPLDRARDVFPETGLIAHVRSPIHQGLANSDPDVDAVYRMLFPLPLEFKDSDPIFLTGGSWCPFNSQNTTFFREALPLLYLPSHCSFRMTDIWRSFVARRILGEMGTGILFHEATVRQDRNEHDLMRDFSDEISGYIANDEMRSALIDLNLDASSGIAQMMECCYSLLISKGWIGAREEQLLESWLHDLRSTGLIR